jgi:TrpR-related protein YerC/YecD
MKKRFLTPENSRQAPAEALCEAFVALKTSSEVYAFLADLCTPAELESLADRWRVVPLLLEETPYREIHDRTAVSVTTIGRVARCLNTGSGYQTAVKALGLHRPQAKS